MAMTPLFATPFYAGRIEDEALRADLAVAAHALARGDAAGRRWSRDHRYAGYTSYASLNDLPQRDPAFADLVRALGRHVRAFADAAGLDLPRPKLDSIWVNILKPGGMHSGHIHPHSAISGTYYVEVPEGAGGLRLEDPRMPLMMAAPRRRDDADPASRPYVVMAPEPGTVFLWESWLRHEVLPGSGTRISISFNYR